MRLLETNTTQQNLSPKVQPVGMQPILTSPATLCNMKWWDNSPRCLTLDALLTVFPAKKTPKDTEKSKISNAYVGNKLIPTQFLLLLLLFVNVVQHHDKRCH